MDVKLTKTPTGVIYSFDYSEEISDFDRVLQNLQPTDETLKGLVKTGVIEEKPWGATLFTPRTTS